MSAKPKFLPLSTYATKYRISVSTLRRKIKGEKINYQLEAGKYFLLDEPPDDYLFGPASELTTQTTQMNSQLSSHLDSQVSSQMDSQASTPATVEAQLASQVDIQGNEAVFLMANRMLDDLKRAYMVILQEKEEQILQLKGEIADLRTLVRVLESENRRLGQSDQDFGELAEI